MSAGAIWTIGHSTHSADRFRELLKRHDVTAIADVCAEGLWWQCHRALIADRLKAQGVKVFHIFPDGKLEEHPYSPAARVENGTLSYRSAAESGA